MFNSYYRKNGKMDYWYFVTDSFKDEILTLEPRIPDTANSDEGYILRICVAPTVIQCLGAIWPKNLDNGLTVYRTTKKVKGHLPKKVSDQCITDERWLLDSTTFQKIEFINPHKNNSIYSFFDTRGWDEDESPIRIKNKKIGQLKEMIKLEKYLREEGYEHLLDEKINLQDMLEEVKNSGITKKSTEELSNISLKV